MRRPMWRPIRDNISLVCWLHRLPHFSHDETDLTTNKDTQLLRHLEILRLIHTLGLINSCGSDSGSQAVTCPSQLQEMWCHRPFVKASEVIAACNQVDRRAAADCLSMSYMNTGSHL